MSLFSKYITANFPFFCLPSFHRSFLVLKKLTQHLFNFFNVLRSSWASLGISQSSSSHSSPCFNKQKPCLLPLHFSTQLHSAFYSTLIHTIVATSVTRFGEISPLWQKFKSFWPFLESLFRIWQKFLPTLDKFICYWANFHCCKQPNIELII